MLGNAINTALAVGLGPELELAVPPASGTARGRLIHRQQRVQVDPHRLVLQAVADSADAVVFILGGDDGEVAALLRRQVVGHQRLAESLRIVVESAGVELVVGSAVEELAGHFGPRLRPGPARACRPAVSAARRSLSINSQKVMLANANMATTTSTSIKITPRRFVLMSLRPRGISTGRLYGSAS